MNIFGRSLLGPRLEGVLRWQKLWTSCQCYTVRIFKRVVCRLNAQRLWSTVLRDEGGVGVSRTCAEVCYICTCGVSPVFVKQNQMYVLSLFHHSAGFTNRLPMINCYLQGSSVSTLLTPTRGSAQTQEPDPLWIEMRTGQLTYGATWLDIYCTITYSLTHSFTHSLTTHSLIHLLTYSLTHSLTHLLTHSLTYSLTH